MLGNLVDNIIHQHKVANHRNCEEAHVAEGGSVTIQELVTVQIDQNEED